MCITPPFHQKKKIQYLFFLDVNERMCRQSTSFKVTLRN